MHLDWKKQWFSIALILFAVGIVTLIFFPQVKGEASRDNMKGKDMKPLVKIQQVRAKNMLGRVLLVGQTVPEAQVDIAAKYAGRVKQVNVDLGQKVSSGQVLLIQDIGDMELAIAQSEAARLQAQADTAVTRANFYANYQKAVGDYKHSVTNYQRHKALYETGAISRDALDLAEQQMNSAQAALAALKNQGDAIPASIAVKKAQVRKEEKNIAALQKQKDDLILSAPRSGVIGYRQVEVGALVQPGQKLFSIVDCSKMYVDCQLTEHDVAHLHNGMETKVQIESLGRSYLGKIVYISPTVEPSNRTFSVRLALANSDNLLKAGMFARTEVTVLLRKNTFCVPKEALQEQNGEYYLFLVNNQGIAHKQVVQLGLDNDKEYEILTGLKEGDRVVISNIARLKPNMQVKVRQRGGKQ